MKNDTQLQLQAYFDGELDGLEARQAKAWLKEDPEAEALLAELASTRELLRHCGAEIRLPESREFFWSKIERTIATQARPGSRPRNEWLSLLPAWRFFVPAGSLVALVITAVLAVRAPETANVPANESTVSDPGAMTYRDEASGTTLVWLSYPAEGEMAVDNDPGD